MEKLYPTNGVDNIDRVISLLTRRTSSQNWKTNEVPLICGFGFQ